VCAGAGNLKMSMGGREERGSEKVVVKTGIDSIIV